METKLTILVAGLLQAMGFLLLVLLLLKPCNSYVLSEDEWQSATATHSKEAEGGSLITGGACGYGDLHKSSYGKYSAGLSTMLFNRGSACGACFEVRCVDHIRWCLPGSPSVVLTATDFCPPNYGLSSAYGGWCNFPQKHFEMSETAFSKIAVGKADFVPVQYRRVSCLRAGGLRFTDPTKNYQKRYLNDSANKEHIDSKAFKSSAIKGLDLSSIASEL
ncbi:hypothetical protein MLD38_024417 [Melastoma candidum]|uniref:Uncharacterized protein n=1 Tax=Melastoma candidum TaxID=119954 RepID=A0ACB9NS86_9MYRT|nr:hypothetical protein MLD38_024417 [Melastoma candidum]